MTIDVTNADIALAERLLRDVNGGREPYAGSVLPAARLLVAYRGELLAMIADELAPTPFTDGRPASDAAVLKRARELVAELRGTR